MSTLTGLVVAVLALLAVCSGREPEPGPAVKTTNGQPWPRPQQRVVYDGFMVLRPTVFNFEVTNENCDMLQDALKRYYKVIMKHSKIAARASRDRQRKRWRKDDSFTGYLNTLQVKLIAPCETFPYLNMDEHYELRVNSPGSHGEAMLTSQSIWGILRGLETFSQLFAFYDGGAALIVNSTSILDFPRFSHRGLLLDTSRHFLPKTHILKTLDAMAFNKMNVFHWHIVDDQSFPYQSTAFPALSQKGAYHPLTHVYTRDDVKHVVEHARQRGIRVVPEFDTPGHVRSWGEGVANLLTTCYSDQHQPDGTYGPINPTLSSTYSFLKTFFDEVVHLFPEKYVHLGGDEVNFDCWSSNPDIRKFMDNLNITGNYAKLEEIYIQKLVDIVTALKASVVVWQEVFDNGVTLQNDTVVHIWTGVQEYELAKVTAAGNPALLSSCWYLDHLQNNWRKYYGCEPTSFNGTEEQKSLVLGGEACMWGELVDDTNVHSRIWPRASAVAEKLWSDVDVTDEDEAAHRLEEHTCRLKRRGIPAQPPNGPGFCLS